MFAVAVSCLSNLEAQQLSHCVPLLLLSVQAGSVSADIIFSKTLGVSCVFVTGIHINKQKGPPQIFEILYSWLLL